MKIAVIGIGSILMGDEGLGIAVVEELKKREKEIRKQVEQEMGLQEKKMTMAVDLITAIIDGIVSASTTPQTGGSEIAKFTQLVRQSLGGVGNGGGNSGPDEVNSGGEGAN